MNLDSKLTRRALLTTTIALPVVMTLLPAVARAQGSWVGQGVHRYSNEHSDRAEADVYTFPGTWEMRQQKLERRLQENRDLTLYGGFGER